jgi:hypothetical protein
MRGCARLTRTITMAKGCGNVAGIKWREFLPRSGICRRAGISKPLHAMRFVPSVVRHVKGATRPLQPHTTYDTSNAGTSVYSSNGRMTETQGTQRGREAVVTVGGTSYQGPG